jgi:hypothetical protein
VRLDRAMASVAAPGAIDFDQAVATRDQLLALA